ncbi:MAG: hypothetical protein D6722_20085 [Bacteroidetes bacterium]|nr:MAG: hypothetical protein D6722_20085 [Bacteroidota bacterium]
MNINLLRHAAYLMMALLMVACGGSTEKQQEEEQEQPPVEQAKSGRSLQLKDIGLASPESVTSDGTNYYVSNLGKEVLPSEKDGDGFIMQLDFEGNVLAEKFIEGLDAPKGMVILDGKLYVTDIDKVKVFSLPSGEAAGEIDFSGKGTQFLNDLAVKSPTELFVSATDINRIYTINLADNSFDEVEVTPTIQKPNGLWYDDVNRELYVASYPNDNTGTISKVLISNRGNEYSKVNDFQGGLDGLVFLGNMIIFTDWNRSAVLLMDLGSGRVGGYPLPEGVSTIDGPADLYFDEAKGEFWIPGMRENTLTIQTLL